jgi:translation initiation factor 3 subunit B
MSDDFDEDDIDFSDLREQFEVRLEEGLDTFVVVDGLPVVPEESQEKLLKYVLRKLNAVGETRAETAHMPVNDESGKTEG